MRRTFLMVASIGGLLGSLLQPASAAGPAAEPQGRSPMQQGAVQTSDDYWKSEKGLDLLRYMDAVNNGQMTMQEAHKAFRQKWYNGAPPKARDAAPTIDIPR